MENKINIAELLKDCPKGMELDCSLFENLEFDHIDKDNGAYSIICCVKTEWGYNTHTFTEYGCYGTQKYSKCVIFPKGKTTWEGFVPSIQFKDGDIVYFITKNNNEYITIFKNDKDIYLETYIDIAVVSNKCSSECSFYIDNIKKQRLATEEEKEKLFDAIKANGYKWNEETKTLEKLIGTNFHEGDWIACEELNTAKILSINMDRYEVEFIDGNKAFPHIDYIDRNFHLWTIEDAKDGDILAFNDETIVIFKDLYNKTSFHSYCHIEEEIFTISKKDMPDWWEEKGFYPATEEQRTFLFRKIKEAGYKWNPETKTLEKLPKFKVGNRVKSKINQCEYKIIDIRKDVYIMNYANDKFAYHVPFCDEDNFSLVPNKFDITTLKVFDKVLVRDSNEGMWSASIFSHTWENKYICIGIWYNQCIPYEGNEHLLGTANDCDEYYKTWE